MPDLVKYSDVTPTQTADVNNNAIVSMANVVSNEYVSGVVTMTTLGSKLNNNIEYSSALQTTSKTIIGAINEVAQGGGGGGSSTLAGLTDVTITTPTDGQALVYDSANSKWVNGAGGGNANIWEGTQAQYDAIVTKDPDTVYFITDGTPEQLMHSYSTTEQIVGTWTDGSTVYEKVCTGTTDGDTAQVLVSGVDKVVSMTGHAGVYSLPAPYLDNNRRYIAVVVSNNDAKVYTMGSNYTGLSFEVVLRYTKVSS